MKVTCGSTYNSMKSESYIYDLGVIFGAKSVFSDVLFWIASPLTVSIRTFWNSTHGFLGIVLTIKWSRIFEILRWEDFGEELQKIVISEIEFFKMCFLWTILVTTWNDGYICLYLQLYEVRIIHLWLGGHFWGKNVIFRDDLLSPSSPTICCRVLWNLLHWFIWRLSTMKWSRIFEILSWEHFWGGITKNSDFWNWIF